MFLFLKKLLLKNQRKFSWMISVESLKIILWKFIFNSFWEFLVYFVYKEIYRHFLRMSSYNISLPASGTTSIDDKVKPLDTLEFFVKTVFIIWLAVDNLRGRFVFLLCNPLISFLFVPFKAFQCFLFENLYVHYKNWLSIQDGRGGRWSWNLWICVFWTKILLKMCELQIQLLHCWIIILCQPLTDLTKIMRTPINA